MKRKLFTLSLMTLLTACGGGGGGSSSSNEAPRTVNKPNMPAQTAQKGTAQKQDQSKPAQPQSQDPQVNQPNNIQPQVAQPAEPKKPSVVQPDTAQVEKPSVKPTEPVEPQAKSENLGDFYTEGLSGIAKTEDPLDLTIDIYEGDPNGDPDINGNDSDKNIPAKTNKNKIAIVKLVASSSEIVKDKEEGAGGSNFYFVPLGTFQNGYAGYYYRNGGQKDKLIPKFVTAVNKNARMDANSVKNLTASFQKQNGFLYASKSALENQIVKRADIDIKFENGNASGHVRDNETGVNSTLFDITGNTESLTFTATEDQEHKNLGIKKGDKASSDHDNLSFVKGDDGKVKYVTGRVEGDSFHGSYIAEKSSQ